MGMLSRLKNLVNMLQIEGVDVGDCVTIREGEVDYVVASCGTYRERDGVRTLCSPYEVGRVLDRRIERMVEAAKDELWSTLHTMAGWF